MFFLNSPWINPWAPTDPFLKKKNYMSYGFHAGTNFVEKADFIGNKYGKSMAKICAYAMDFFTCLIVNPTALFYNSTIGPFINAFIRRSNRVAMEGKAYISWKPSSYKPILTLASIALTFFIARKGLNAFLSTAPNFPANSSSIPLASLQHSFSSSLVKVMDPSSLGSFPDLRNLTKAGLALLTIAIPVGIFYVWKTKPQPLVQAPDISNARYALGKQEKTTPPPAAPATASDIGEQAIAFALKKLDEYSKNSRAAPPSPTAERTHKTSSLLEQVPVNAQIISLQKFLDESVIPAFDSASEAFTPEKKNDTTLEKALFDAADVRMKVSCAISCLNLRNISSFVAEKNIKEKKKFTPAQFLAHKTLATYKYYRSCTDCYRNIIRGHSHTPDSTTYDLDLFFTEDTPQRTWNLLYNFYCQLRKELVSDEDLKKAGREDLVEQTLEHTRETESTFLKSVTPTKPRELTMKTQGYTGNPKQTHGSPASTSTHVSPYAPTQMDPSDDAPPPLRPIRTDLPSPKPITAATATTAAPAAAAAALQDYPDFGRKAIAFALRELKEHPEVCHAHNSTPPVAPPFNEEITHLQNYLKEIAAPAYKLAVQAHKDALAKYKLDAGKQGALHTANAKFLAATDVCIKVSYAISCLTLDDLPQLIKMFKVAAKTDLTLAHILTSQSFAASKYSFTCARRYHSIRYHDFSNPDIPLSKEYSDLFYSEATLQHSWNRLYNDYCQRRKRLVSNKELRAADGQLLVTLTQEDYGA